MWTEVVGDGVERLHHFRNYLRLRTAWCYHVTKCAAEVPGEEKANQAGQTAGAPSGRPVGAPSGRLDFQRVQPNGSRAGT